MKVPRYRYPAQFGANAKALLAEIGEMILEGRYVLTKEVSEFESAFAGYLGAGHVRGVDCGTDALAIALRAIGAGPGDEVITQANTFHATVAAILLAGATPVLVDAEEDSFLIDQAQALAAVTRRTRAIIPVHLYGKPTPLDALLHAARREGLAVIEDAAQAHGARLGGRAAGTFGEIGCFSFHPSKNLAAAGDGGALATNSDALAESISRLRNLGQCGSNNHVTVGLNSKLDAIQARILSWKLPRLDAWNRARREAAARYRARLSDLPVRFQSVAPGEEHVYHLFQVRTDSRDELLAHLRESDVDAVLRYPTPIHLQPAFADCGWRPGQFPVAERLARELLCLPIRPDLSVEETDYVCDRIREFFACRASAA